MVASVFNYLLKAVMASRICCIRMGVVGGEFIVFICWIPR